MVDNFYGNIKLSGFSSKDILPYNTNINKGLIPGPISNPGLNSINAALNPDNTNYHYYVLDTKSEVREHHFSETYDEHVNFINKLKEG